MSPASIRKGELGGDHQEAQITVYGRAGQLGRRSIGSSEIIPIPCPFDFPATSSYGCRGGLARLFRSRLSACVRVALFQPEIAGNVGAILRLGACLGTAVDLIEPMGFTWDDRRVRRTAMDYIDHVTVVRHASFDAFRALIASPRLVLFTTKSDRSAYDFSFMADDVLLFGKESGGVPSSIAGACNAQVRLPMQPQVRSMNLAMSAALALGEALRQTDSLPR